VASGTRNARRQGLNGAPELSASKPKAKARVVLLNIELWVFFLNTERLNMLGKV
jgi:hypothetical protein